MKNILYTIIGLFVLASCTDFDIADQGFTLEALPESVAFDGSGDGINADDDGDEGDDVTITVEATNGGSEDITVTYTLGGTATFGSDYTIAGATATGGTMTIEHDASDVTNFDNGDIDITLLNDRDNGEADETIIITLTSASRGGETIAVGRGGTAFGATATVTISDDPFEFNLSTNSLSSTESAVGDTLTFFAQLNFATDVDVTYDMNTLASSSLAVTTNFTYATTAGSITPGTGLTIAAGETSDTVRVVLVDNGAIASATAMDSLEFNITNASVSSGDIWVGGATATAATAADTISIAVADDVKSYGFTMSSDTVSVDEITTYNYVVQLSDTTTNAASVAFADVSIPYTFSGSATAGVDYNDVTGGTVTILAGESSAILSVQVIRVGEMTPPTFRIDLGAHTSTDAEVDGVGANSQINVDIE